MMIPHKVKLGLIAFMVLSACGPDPALLKSYVTTSQRRDLAVMPFSIADRQIDMRQLAERTADSKLSELGFMVSEQPSADGTQTVFGPSNSPPRLSDVKAYGARCSAAVVLVGRIDRAQPGRPFAFATYKQVQRSRRQANGEWVNYEQQVQDHPQQQAKSPLLSIKLKLIDVATGRELWVSKQDPIPAEWTLDEAVQSTVEQQILDLAATYRTKKL